MKSEIIVVLILTALAVGFIIWVRVQSKRHDRPGSGDAVGQQGTAEER